MSYQEGGEGCTTVGEAHEPCDFALRIVNVVVVVVAAVVAFDVLIQCVAIV